MNLVSIILPTYNRGRLIEDCIFSVLVQTYYHIEIIVSDDCSQDETESVVLEISRLDSRIKYIRNAVRKGLPGNRNVGLTKAKGKFIFFIEDDMILDSNCVELLVRDMNHIRSRKINIGGIAPALLVECESGYKPGILNEGSRKASKTMSEPCIIDKLTGVHFYNFSTHFSSLREVPDVHACSFYTREAINSVGGYDDKRYKGNYLYEETDLNMRIHKKGFSFYFEPTAVIHHRMYSSGGCRVNVRKYVYYYVTNHIKFVTKNYGICSVYMIPSFIAFIAYTGIKSVLLNMINSQKSD